MLSNILTCAHWPLKELIDDGELSIAISRLMKKNARVIEELTHFTFLPMNKKVTIYLNSLIVFFFSFLIRNSLVFNMIEYIYIKISNKNNFYL